MRTTIDLPEDLHEIAKSVARDRRETFRQAVAELTRRGLAAPGRAEELTRSPVTGPLVMRGTGRPITGADARALDGDA